MPWKECSMTQERPRFVARLVEGKGMSEVCRDCAKSGRFVSGEYRRGLPARRILEDRDHLLHYIFCR
jgi:hypothetical protein